MVATIKAAMLWGYISYTPFCILNEISLNACHDAASKRLRDSSFCPSSTCFEKLDGLITVMVTSSNLTPHKQNTIRLSGSVLEAQTEPVYMFSKSTQIW